MMEKFEITWLAGEYHHDVYAINKSFSVHSKHLTLYNVDWFMFELVDYLDI
jgi:hypothetical protein